MRAALGALVLAACGGSDAPKAAAIDPALMKAGEGEQLLERWQGAWDMPFTVDDGTAEVWAVDGTKFTRWDGAVTEERTLSLLARCLARSSWGDRGRQFTYHAFAFTDGKLVVDSIIGAFDGASFTVCDDLGFVYTFDGHACRYWEQPIVNGKKLEPHPATCNVTGDAYELSSPDDVTGPHVLRKDGDLLLRETSTRDAATHYDTLDAAKAARQP